MNKHHQLVCATGIALTLLFTSCFKGKIASEIPAEYNTILSLKQSSVTQVPLYRTGKDGNFTVTVLKGGTMPQRTAKAKLEVLDESDLITYAANTGTNLTLLPSNVYSVESPEVEFDSQTTSLTKSITFKTNEIDELIKADKSKNYVLPIRLVSAADSVNADKSLVLLTPELRTPEIGFATASLQQTITINNKEAGEATVRLLLPFDSTWSFDATISIDSEQTSIPLNLLSLEKDGKTTFDEGDNQSAPVKLTVNKNGMLCASGLISLKLASTSLDFMKIKPEKAAISLFHADPAQQIKLTADMLSTNQQEPSEGPLAGAVDNNPQTFFHSTWSQAVQGLPYIQVNLKEPIQQFNMGYKGRHNNAQADPKKLRILVSADGADWKEAGTISFVQVGLGGTTYGMQDLAFDQPYKFLRIELQSNRSGSSHLVLAELYLYGR